MVGAIPLSSWHTILVHRPQGPGHRYSLQFSYRKEHSGEPVLRKGWKHASEDTGQVGDKGNLGKERALPKVEEVLKALFLRTAFFLKLANGISSSKGKSSESKTASTPLSALLLPFSHLYTWAHKPHLKSPREHAEGMATTSLIAHPPGHFLREKGECSSDGESTVLWRCQFLARHTAKWLIA